MFVIIGVDVDPYQMIYLLVFPYCPQIKVDKPDNYITCRWMDINNLECTWEPKSHFVGTAAEAKLKEYISLKDIGRS